MGLIECRQERLLFRAVETLVKRSTICCRKDYFIKDVFLLVCYCPLIHSMSQRIILLPLLYFKTVVSLSNKKQNNSRTQ